MVMQPHGQAMRAGGGYAARRLLVSMVILALIGFALTWFVTDGFRALGWRDLIEWREYQTEQAKLP